MIVYLLMALIATLSGAWAFRRVLVADRARWERREENRRLYEAVAGSVLVPGLAGFDVYPSSVVPEDTILIVPADVFHGAGLITDPIYSVGQDETDAQWRGRYHMAYSMPVITRPERIFKITGVA